MSGGRFNYNNDHTCNEIFDYMVSADYGLDDKETKSQSKKAAMLNPLEDFEISELVYDVFCVLHSYDWYASGDTGEETYRNDVAYFKKKWFGKTAKERVKKLTDNAIERFAHEIRVAMGVETTDADNQ